MKICWNKKHALLTISWCLVSLQSTRAPSFNSAFSHTLIVIIKKSHVASYDWFVNAPFDWLFQFPLMLTLPCKLLMWNSWEFFLVMYIQTHHYLTSTSWTMKTWCHPCQYQQGKHLNIHLKNVPISIHLFLISMMHLFGFLIHFCASFIMTVKLFISGQRVEVSPVIWKKLTYNLNSFR